MITYIWKSSLSLIIFFGLYWFLLRKEKLFVFNRYFLVLSVVISLILPLISIPVNFRTLPELKDIIPAYDYLSPQLSTPEESYSQDINNNQQFVVNQPAGINISKILTVLYLVVVIFLLIRFLRNIYLIYNRIKLSDEISIEGYRIILTDETSNPYCFFDSIFLSRDDYMNGRIDNELLEHEMEHARQSHTFDIIFIELVKVFYWFNPVNLLYEKAIRINHEYLADNGVISTDHDIKKYADILVRYITGMKNIPLTSGINHSFTKKRLLMMVKARSNGIIYGLRIAMVLVLFIVLSLFMSFKRSDDFPTGRGDQINRFAASQSKTIKDIEGNVYKTVIIGNTVWMAENLRTNRYNDGSLIPIVQDTIKWQKYDPAFCWYNNDEAGNKKDYGGLYNWYVVNSRKLCPAGWHVPDKYELNSSIKLFDSLVTGKLKETGTAHWKMPDKRANNESGFTALPGGYRMMSGEFGYQGEAGLWWTSSEENEFIGFGWTINSRDKRVGPVVSSKRSGLSVRCIKDPDYKGKIIMPEIRDVCFMNPDFSPAKSLVVLNGSVLDYDKNLTMDPALIKSFRILKNDEAVTKYGERAKDGALEVVLHEKDKKISFGRQVSDSDSDTAKYKTRINMNKVSTNGEIINIPVKELLKVEMWTYKDINQTGDKESRYIVIMTRDFYQVKGKVTKPNGRPLSGVRISSTDNPVRATSNRKGIFKIEDVWENSILEFSRPGYEPYYLSTTFSVPYIEDMPIKMQKGKRVPR